MCNQLEVFQCSVLAGQAAVLQLVLFLQLPLLLQQHQAAGLPAARAVPLKVFIFLRPGDENDSAIPDLVSASGQHVQRACTHAMLVQVLE